jgi:hypothetical protein
MNRKGREINDLRGSSGEAPGQGFALESQYPEQEGEEEEDGKSGLQQQPFGDPVPHEGRQVGERVAFSGRKDIGIDAEDRRAEGHDDHGFARNGLDRVDDAGHHGSDKEQQAQKTQQETHHQLPTPASGSSALRDHIIK